MNILFLADIVPYPPNTGIKIRTWNTLVRLHRHGHRVFLLCFNHRVFIRDEATKRAYQEELRRHCEEVSIFEIPSERNVSARYALLARSLIDSVPYRVRRYYSRECAAKVADTISSHRIDLIHLDKTELHGYSEPYPHILAVPTNHNVESLLFLRRAGHEVSRAHALFSRLQAHRTRCYEQRILGRAPAYIACTDVDAAYFRNELGIVTPCMVIENGVDVDYYQPLAAPKDDYVVIMGAQSREATANYDATMFFMASIWPIVRQHDSAIRLRIVGRNPDPSVLALHGRDNVEVVGFVPDEREDLGRARLLAVPLRIGGGSRLKIVTAMSMGTCVLSTSVGAEGIACRDGQHICIADAPEDFAGHLVRLYQDETTRQRIAVGGRRLAEEHYDWDIIGAKLDALYRSLIVGRAST